MAERFFVDTSGWYAFLNGRDPAHERVRRFLATEIKRLATTNYVFDELITLVQARVGHAKAVVIGDYLRRARGVEWVRVGEKDEAVAWKLFSARGGRGYSFTDCTSFAVMRELGMHRAVALDKHFVREGFEVVP